MNKTKVAITLDKDVAARLDAYAAKMEMSRSAAANRLLLLALADAPPVAEGKPKRKRSG